MKYSVKKWNRYPIQLNPDGSIDYDKYFTKTDIPKTVIEYCKYLLKQSDNKAISIIFDMQGESYFLKLSQEKQID